VQSDAMHKMVDCQRRSRGIACFELPHVVTDTGKAFQPAVVIQELFDRCRRHAFLGQHAEQNARIPIGKPSSAVKPIVLSTLRPLASAHREAPLPK
jgi:hypothetical protein